MSRTGYASAIVEDRRAVDSHRNLPQDYAAVFGSSPSMFPSSVGQVSIHDSALATIRASIESSDPGVDDQTGAGLEAVWLTRGIAGVEGIKKSGGGELLRGVQC